jgi:hypothetical protein
VENEIASKHFVERPKLEMAELKLRDCSAKLEMEQAQRKRIEACFYNIKKINLNIIGN